MPGAPTQAPQGSSKTLGQQTLPNQHWQVSLPPVVPDLAGEGHFLPSKLTGPFVSFVLASILVCGCTWLILTPCSLFNF